MIREGLTRRHWRAELALASVAFIWGGTFVLVKSALSDISAVLFLAVRFSIAAVLLAPLYFKSRARMSESWRAGALVGPLLFGGYLLQTLGLRHTTPAKSGFITGLYIVMVPLMSAAFYKRNPGLWEWLGFALAAAGMVLMSLNSARFDIGIGDLLTLGCAVVFAAHILVLGHFAKRMGAGPLAFLQVGTAAGLAWVSLPLIEHPFVRWSPPVIVALLVTSILATAVAFYVQTWGQRHTTPTRAAILFALEPVFAWTASFLLEGEVLSHRAVFGAACILAGVLCVEMKPLGTGSHQSP